jgi:hypothetical protein
VRKYDKKANDFSQMAKNDEKLTGPAFRRAFLLPECEQKVINP